MHARILKRCGGLAAAILLATPFVAVAEFNQTSLPAGSAWYFHSDLREMRTSEGGRDLHAWLDREVFSELKRKAGIDLAKEADRVTAFSTGREQVTFILEGNIEETSKDKLTALASMAEEFETYSHRKRPYFFVKGDRQDDDGDSDNGDSDDNIDFDGFDRGAWVSFAIDGKLIATSTEAALKELLDNQGEVAGSKSHDGALFVLTAERNLVQAGVDADELASRGGDDWDSNFLKNARQVAFLLAESGGRLAMEARMVALDAEKAQALASIGRGILALQAFSEDMKPEVRELLQAARIDVDDTELQLKLSLDPALVVATLDD